MKTCFKCERGLPLTEFYWHPNMGDGHLGKCKECTRTDVRENREKRRGQYVEYDRRRSRTPERRQALELSRERWADRERARINLHNALRRGKITRPKACQDCGIEGPVEGHHEDYSKPLEVAWVCRRCHGKRHRIQPAA